VLNTFLVFFVFLVFVFVVPGERGCLRASVATEAEGADS